ncbi:MAG: universal stress protein [Thermoplasmataceae archaeon]
MKAVVAYDDSDAAKQALRFSMKFSAVIDEYIIVYVTPSLVGVTPTFDTYIPASVYQRQEETSESIIASAKNVMGEGSVNASFVNMDSKGETVPKSIMRVAKERGADLIITGTRKLSGLSKAILGSVSSEIIKLSDIPVLIAPPL